MSYLVTEGWVPTKVRMCRYVYASCTSPKPANIHRAVNMDTQPFAAEDYQNMHVAQLSHYVSQLTLICLVLAELGHVTSHLAVPQLSC